MVFSRPAQCYARLIAGRTTARIECRRRRPRVGARRARRRCLRRRAASRCRRDEKRLPAPPRMPPRGAQRLVARSVSKNTAALCAVWTGTRTAVTPTDRFGVRASCASLRRSYALRRSIPFRRCFRSAERRCGRGFAGKRQAQVRANHPRRRARRRAARRARPARRRWPLGTLRLEWRASRRRRAGPQRGAEYDRGTVCNRKAVGPRAASRH